MTYIDRKKQLFSLLQLIVVAVIVLIGQPSYAQDSTAVNEGKIPVKFGVLIRGINDLKLRENEFSTKLSVWFVHDQEDLHFIDTLEIVNAKNFEKVSSFRKKINGVIWELASFNATILQKWSLRHFPFDTQQLTIRFANIDDNYANVVFEPDFQDSNLGPFVFLDGWNIIDTDFKIKEIIAKNTTFGDPRLDKGDGIKINIAVSTISIKRIGLSLFFTLFLGYFVASILVMVVLWANMSNSISRYLEVGPRIVMCNGAIFATLSSIYVIGPEMPPTDIFTFPDILKFTTFLLILVALIITIINGKRSSKDSDKKKRKMKRANKAVFISMASLQLMVIAWLLISSS